MCNVKHFLKHHYKGSLHWSREPSLESVWSFPKIPFCPIVLAPLGAFAKAFSSASFHSCRSFEVSACRSKRYNQYISNREQDQTNLHIQLLVQRPLNYYTFFFSNFSMFSLLNKVLLTSSVLFFFPSSSNLATGPKQFPPKSLKW